MIDVRRDVITRGDTTTRLVPKTMEVLKLLAERAGDVVGQAEIEKVVWGNVIVTPSSVYQAIMELRRALGDDRQRPAYILTIPRKGYQLIARVEWIAAATTPAATTPAAPLTPPATATTNPAPTTTNAAPTTTSDTGRLRRRRSDRWLAHLSSRTAFVAYAIAAIALAATIWLSPRTPAAPAAVAAPQKSIAVLPITDLSEERNATNFADGLTEELLITLSRIPGLKVPARTSVYRFKDRGEDVRRIGESLGTRYVLEGSVRRNGDKLRVTAQLIDARDGYQLWSRNFDRPAGDVIALQEDIARAVTESLEVSLSADGIPRLASLRRSAPQSYELYMLGRHSQLQRRPESIERAIDYQRQAIAKDPQFVLAYAGLADAIMSGFYYANRPLAEVAAEIEPILARGFALDARHAELFAARGLLRMQQLRLDDARRDLEQAVALDPGSAEPLVRLATAHEYSGHTRDALKLLDRALALDPLHMVLHIRRCLALQNLGRYRDADAACARAIELDPEAVSGPWTRGLIALSSGGHAEAIRGYRAALAKAPDRVDLLGQLGYLYLDLGMADDATAVITRATAASAPGQGFAFFARARGFVAANDIAALRQHLDTAGSIVPADVEDAVDRALLELIAQRPAVADRFATLATQHPHFDRLRLQNVWHVRWAHSDALTLSIVARAAGRPAEAARHLADVDAYLDELERHGNVWHGLYYLRACVRAQQGREKEAYAALRRAVALGWRRTWWANQDPALAPLRSTAEFAAILQTAKAASAKQREQL